MANRAHYCLLVALLCACQRGSLSERLHREAELHSREGRPDEAAATLDRALRFDPADRVALEQLVVLKLRSGDADGALALTRSDGAQQVSSVKLRNARVTAAMRSGNMSVALDDARVLAESGKLSAEVERELIDELVAGAGTPSPWLGAYERMPERWFAEGFERVLETGDLERAAAVFLARSLGAQDSPEGRALKQRLLARALREDFPLGQEALQRLTRLPEGPLEYLGRLEYALRAGDEAEAVRLQPAPSALVPPYAAAWRLRLARLATRRADWYGVLDRTQEPPFDDARDEARRQALRCWAQLKLGERRAAKAQLAAWLAQPAAAQSWSASLLLPELTNAESELTELRSEVLKARAQGLR